MLNTKKLIYVLSDVAFLAELLPGKKPHSHTIQNFKQVNGEFIDGNKLLADNIAKLFEKFEVGEYALIIPDHIFTNTILNIEADSEAEVKEHLKQEVLSSINVSGDSHLLETFILTEFKGTYKVQLAAIQKSMLQPVKAAVENSEIKIEKVLPLSWTIKSLISLEPSISILQLGNYLYLSKHYIGVDQPVLAKLDNPDKMVETVKMLKGSEPSIQTVYLVSNELIEQELKEKLSDVLPIQQIAEAGDEEVKIPPYIDQIIRSGMKTISIEDFAVPEFDLEDIEFDTSLVGQSESSGASSKKEGEEAQDKKELPKPGTSPTESTKQDSQEEPGLDKSEEENQEQVEQEVELDADEQEALEVEPTQKIESAQEVEQAIEEEDDEEVDLNQFVSKHKADAGAPVVKQSQSETAEPSSLESKEQEAEKSEAPEPQKPQKPKKKKKVIKNKDGVNSFVKMFFIGLASFAVTVALGVGIGLGVLQLSQNDQIESPVGDEVAQTTPSPEPSPSPTPLPEINKEELAIKVVNATTKSGYAGDVSADLEEAGYGTVTASNARGEYKEGFYLLMAEEDQALLQTLEKDTGFELSYQSEVATEDPQEQFDAVLVLAE